MECWNTGYEKRKKIYSTKNVVSTFYDDAHQASIFCFHPENMPVLRENQYNYIRFDTLNPPLQYSRTHDSIIPIAERSGAKFKYIFRLGQIRAFRIVVPCQTFSSGVITNSEIHP